MKISFFNARKSGASPAKSAAGTGLVVVPGAQCGGASLKTHTLTEAEKNELKITVTNPDQDELERRAYARVRVSGEIVNHVASQAAKHGVRLFTKGELDFIKDRKEQIDRCSSDVVLWTQDAAIRGYKKYAADIRERSALGKLPPEEHVRTKDEFMHEYKLRMHGLKLHRRKLATECDGISHALSQRLGKVAKLLAATMEEGERKQQESLGYTFVASEPLLALKLMALIKEGEILVCCDIDLSTPRALLDFAQRHQPEDYNNAGSPETKTDRK